MEYTCQPTATPSICQAKVAKKRPSTKRRKSGNESAARTPLMEPFDGELFKW